MKMMPKMGALVGAVILSGLSANAFASDLCHVPEKEWQPKEALQKKLEAEGWDVKKIKVDDGCYEAYAKDAEGHKVEVYFDPKTFEIVKKKKED